jgi:hypothetical protein
MNRLSLRLDKSNRKGPFNGFQSRKFSSKIPKTPLFTDGAIDAKSSVDKNYKHFMFSSKKVVSKFFLAINSLGALVTLERSGRPNLSSLFRNLGFRLFGACFPGRGKYLSRMRQLNAFRVHIYNIYRNHGSQYTVVYLKACQLAIQKAIAGTKVTSLRDIAPDHFFKSLSTCGLPMIIPLRDRKLMLNNGSPSVIRWWLTLFSVYRVIYIPGVLKLATITDPLTVSLSSINEVAVPLTKLVNPAMFDLDRLREEPKLLFLESASSTKKVSWTGMLTDLMYLKHHDMLNPIFEICNLLHWDSFHKLIAYLSDNVWDIAGISQDIHFVKACMEDPEHVKNVHPQTGSLKIGKLSIKEEAAGKLRVFAMVDVWTQSILKPLHDFLFAFLRKIPNDGTMDQHKSVERCFHKSGLTGRSFGYDLSAATDRLPISLQKGILDILVPGFGEPWEKLLVGREYFLANKESEFVLTPVPEQRRSRFRKSWFTRIYNLKYAVGQPMGALSSWAMLAVTHHYIAQYSALLAQKGDGKFWISENDTVFNLNGRWYTGYEVLGDDIVFFEEDVAHEYLQIMEKLGVPINLSKSVIANNPTFEFAKVTGHKNNHVAAISWASFMSQPTLMGRANIAFSLLRKGIIRENINKWIKTMSRESRYVVGKPNTMYLALCTMFSNRGQLNALSFLANIMKQSAGHFSLYNTLVEESNISRLEQVIPALVRGEEQTIPDPLHAKRGWKRDLMEIKQTYITVIQTFIHGGDYGDGKPTDSLNPHKDAVLLARKILIFVLPQLNLGDFSPQQTLDEFDRQKALAFDRTLARSYTPYLKFVNITFMYLFTTIYDQLITLYNEISDIEDLHSLKLEELMDLIDRIDRYKEILKLIERAEQKIAGDSKPKDLEESPLKVLRTLLENDDPYGPDPIGITPSWYGGTAMADYMYAKATLENLSSKSFKQISHPDHYDTGSYLKMFL